jgi:predicted DNA-binding antitoxin AbrB/MazE fold protein
MNQLPIDAVFENGLFRPLNPVHVSVQEGEHVRLRIEEPAGVTSLELAGRVYDGLTPTEIEEVERIALQRGSFFDTRESD